MDALPLPDVADTLHNIAGLSPVAQVAAVIGIACIAGLWIWTRRPQQGPDAATVVETMRVTAQALTETSTSIAAVATSMAGIAQRVDDVAEDVRAVSHQTEQIVSEVRGAVVEMRAIVNAALATIKQAA